MIKFQFELKERRTGHLVTKSNPFHPLGAICNFQNNFLQTFYGIENQASILSSAIQTGTFWSLQPLI